MRRRSLLLGLAAGLAAAAWVPAAGAAEGWPQRPVKLVVPFPAGGNVDAYARVFAPALARRLGQSVVIENKAGATGAIGVESVARSEPDGYTVLLGNVTSVVGTVALNAPLHTDPLTQLMPVCTMVDNEVVLFADPSAGIRSLDDLKAKARSAPVSFGSSGSGSISHLATLQLLDHIGVLAMHVPYKGNGQFLVDLLAGHIQLGMLDLTNAGQYVAAGKLAPLAVTGSSRFPELPDVPATSELGITRPSFSAWIGLLLPAGTSPAIAARLEQAAREAIADADVRAFAGKNGNKEAFRDTAAARELIAQGLADWGAFASSDLFTKSASK